MKHPQREDAFSLFLRIKYLYFPFGCLYMRLLATQLILNLVSGQAGPFKEAS